MSVSTDMAEDTRPARLTPLPGVYASQQLVTALDQGDTGPCDSDVSLQHLPDAGLRAAVSGRTLVPLVPVPASRRHRFRGRA